ncbi:hypothetical protein [Deinococcus ruber]|uniref:DUF2339 domain-containing protein n=1 Tax=Deinococcus ruber TaxID=1848197 RepID=A0A918CEU4_9DEIO|nr:hypothetical protein [Deinococcus ruber]GGR20255.1 hypothetical protein GCM10008957_35850 [Deinococcus ruber]
MIVLIFILCVLVAVLFQQLSALRRRVDALEAQAAHRSVPNESGLQPAFQPPANAAFPVAGSTVPGEADSAAVPDTQPVWPAQRAPAVPRAPLDLQRWLTRAGIAATLIGAAYVLSILEAQGVIGPQWRILAGLGLGGFLTWRATRSGARWQAETFGTLGMAVSLLTLTFAARTSGGVTWTALMTLIAFSSVYLARSWGGIGTPLTSLGALAVALPLSQSVPGPHLWSLDLPGLLCMAWTLVSLALLPLLPDRDGQEARNAAASGGLALTLLLVFNLAAEVGVLNDNRPERLTLTLGVATLTLLGMVLRRTTPQNRREAARTLVAGAAITTGSWTLATILHLAWFWAPAIAALVSAAFFGAARYAPLRGHADRKVLARLTFTSALVAAATAALLALNLHPHIRLNSALFAGAAALLSVLVAALSLNAADAERADAGIKPAAPLLLALAPCVPLALIFGLAGMVLPGVVWLARRPVPRELPTSRPLSGWTLAAVSSWRTLPLALWALVALPLLASGPAGLWRWTGLYSVRSQPTPDLAALAEYALLLLGAAALLVFASVKILAPRQERQPWPAALLLAWSGAWLFAALLAHGQSTTSASFVLTTPWLAMLGGWLLLRAQAKQPGVPAWKWALWMSGAAVLLFALLRVLLFDLAGTDPLVRAAGLLGAGLITVLAGVRFPPPPRDVVG